MRKILFIAVLFALLGIRAGLPAVAGAQTCTGNTCTAASCNPSDVQAALNAITSTFVNVVIPAGTCSWTTTVTLTTTVAALITISGQSTVATTTTIPNPLGGTVTVPLTFTDNTLIVDARTASNQAPLITLTASAASSAQVIRLTGISMKGPTTNGVINNGDLSIAAAFPSQCRFDHNDFIGENANLLTAAFCQSGVADHNLFQQGTNFNGIRVFNNPGADGFGDDAWAAATDLGTADSFYIENNTFINGFTNDCDTAGKNVVRLNLLNITLASGNSAMQQSHATGSKTRNRGCRQWEAYGNTTTFTPSTNTNFTSFFETSGTGVIWGNTTGSGSSHDITLVEDRDNNSTYGQVAPPAGWGYCGSSFNGTASNWDQNTVAGGYACIDQVGRGQGDPLSGNYVSNGGSTNNVQNNTNPGVFTGTYPHQKLEPVYSWLESYAGSGTLVSTSSANGNINPNVDYYFQCGSQNTSCTGGFTGAFGTGSGLLSARPSACTKNVAYWATDTTTLYQCTVTGTPGTWATYYAPFTYPHPLDTSGGGAVSLSPLSLTFANQTVGTTSSAQNATLSNTGSATITGVTISFTGANPGDFTDTTSCGTTLAGSASCQIFVTFTPAAIGTRTATLSVSDSAASSPQTSSLSGTAIPSVINPSPANPVTFGVVVTDPSIPSTVKNEKHSENTCPYDFDHVALVGVLHQERVRNAAGASAR
jgi:Abnormal spindle-like microcephaly-assoc'd, ASPM-SPD-2-Hydin